MNWPIVNPTPCISQGLSPIFTQTSTEHGHEQHCCSSKMPLIHQGRPGAPTSGNHACDHSRTDRFAAFAYRKPIPLSQRDRLVEHHVQCHTITGHGQICLAFHPCGSRDVRRTKEKLGRIAIKKKAYAVPLLPFSTHKLPPRSFDTASRCQLLPAPDPAKPLRSSSFSTGNPRCRRHSPCRPVR